MAVFRKVALSGLMMAALICVSQVQAQVFPRGNGIAMTGVEQFDAYMNISQWDEMEQEQQAFRSKAQQHFTTGLEEAGARRRSGTGNNLICRIQAVRESNVVAYTARLEYWVMTEVGVNTLTWENGALGAVSADRFTEEMVADECVKYFTDEWAKWNSVR